MLFVEMSEITFENRDDCANIADMADTGHNCADKADTGGDWPGPQRWQLDSCLRAAKYWLNIQERPDWAGRRDWPGIKPV